MPILKATGPFHETKLMIKLLSVSHHLQTDTNLMLFDVDFLSQSHFDVYLMSKWDETIKLQKIDVIFMSNLHNF